jgi:hypothetical protein
MNSETINTTAAPDWNYSPALQFFARMINAALIDCKCCLGFARNSHGALVAVPLRGAAPDAVPSDDALLARDWIAYSITPRDLTQRRYLSFAECCRQLGVAWEQSRANLLAVVDKAADYSTDAVRERLAALRVADLPDDVEPLFDAPRIVPAVDQISLF